MLSLQKIIITHFKNYELSAVEFNRPVVGICGLNGVGKTNLLDAIYYCCFTKSYFSSSDQLNIQFNKPGFRLESLFLKDKETLKVVAINRGNNKKEFTVNDSTYEKLSKHIGLLPAVMIAPDDIDIITGGSEGRRKFLDTILCQLDTDYLEQLMRYNKILQQRNSLLKNEYDSGKTDDALLEILDQQLTTPGNIIFEKRESFASTFIPLVHKFYGEIASSKETIVLQYESRLKEERLEDLLIKNRQRDRIMQRTLAGIHKDDLIFSMNEQSFKSIASQGQRKSLLFALKLAEYEIIKMQKGFAPLLLMDDVFEKLDAERMNNLLQWVCKENNGQVFITDTHKARLEQVFERLNVNGQIIEL